MSNLNHSGYEEKVKVLHHDADQQQLQFPQAVKSDMYLILQY